METKNPTQTEHFQNLERMYLAAPINQIFIPTILIQHQIATISMQIKQDYFHGGGAAHGCIYFKLLDDAAYFAAISTEFEVLLLTKTFTLEFLKPVSNGIIKAIGNVIDDTGKEIHAESVLYNSQDEIIGKGSGLFVKSRISLTSAGY